MGGAAAASATKGADRRSVLTDARARHPHRFGTIHAPKVDRRAARHRLDQPTSPRRHPGDRSSSLEV